MPELVEQVFGLSSIIIPDPVSHTPLIVPKGGHKLYSFVAEKQID